MTFIFLIIKGKGECGWDTFLKSAAGKTKGLGGQGPGQRNKPQGQASSPFTFHSPSRLFSYFFPFGFIFNVFPSETRGENKLRDGVLCFQCLVGKLLAWTSFLSFPWKERTPFSSMNNRKVLLKDAVGSSLLQTHHRCITQNLDVATQKTTWQWSPFQEQPQTSLFADKGRKGKWGTTLTNTTPVVATPTLSNSWTLWNVGIFATAFHRCHLREFRTIILLKCFRCHISNP